MSQNNNSDLDTHRGENGHSKKDFMSVNHLAKVSETEETTEIEEMRERGLKNYD